MASGAKLEAAQKRNYASVATSRTKNCSFSTTSRHGVRSRFPNLVVESLSGLSGRTKLHGVFFNSRTRRKDQERAAMDGELKRSMWEKAHMEVRTFALAARCERMSWP